LHWLISVKARSLGTFTEVNEQVLGRLRGPCSVRVRRDTEDMDVAVGDLDDEEHVDPAQSHCAVDVEEVHREHAAGLAMQERPPCRVGGALRAPAVSAAA
jgi:hypothetical protein